MQSPFQVKRFLASTAGKALLIVVAILALVGSFVYLGFLIGIPAMLLFGLALPIWAGLKRPRYLALTGLLILVVAAPAANALITQQLFVPIGPASSPNTLPNGGAVLQNATVAPFSGPPGTNFTWTVTVFPAYLAKGTGTLVNVSLWVSTCPGATGNNSPNCSSGYPFYRFDDRTIPSGNASFGVTFRFAPPSVNIWAWQMAAVVRNSTTGNLSYIFLEGDANYLNGLEGPVVGTFGQIYLAFLGAVYTNVFLYVGAPFYIALLLYMFLKSRQRRRADELARSRAPPASAPSDSGPGSGSTRSASTLERACPNCAAVVYPNESTCWKCGANLSANPASANQPLPSGRPPSG